MITEIKIPIIKCTEGIYLRWYWNGYHYFNFANGYEVVMGVKHEGIQVQNYYSVISWVEKITKIKDTYSFKITLELSEDVKAFEGLMLSNEVYQYDNGWHEVKITRGQNIVKDDFYSIDFEVTRTGYPVNNDSNNLELYIGDTLCDLDPDEVIALTKQVNDIAEMKDRQSDFTASFKIQKTKAMSELFEIAEENNSVIPYTNISCRLIQNGIEMIDTGILNLIKSDKDYYHVSIVSGNKGLFKVIEVLKLSDLLLASTNHTWDVVDARLSQSNNYDYLYPLLEPSNDGSMAAITDTGSLVKLWYGWIYPFIKVKAIWDEIFSNAGYTVRGDILTNPYFIRLWMPVSNLNVTNTDNYLYSLFNSAINNYTVTSQLIGYTEATDNIAWRQGDYEAEFAATYKFRIITYTIPVPPSFISIRKNGAHVGYFTKYYTSGSFNHWEVEVTGVGTDVFTFWVAGASSVYYYFYSITVMSITGANISAGSVVTPRLHLPEMKQSDFVKMICNMFGLIPEVNERDKIIKFWNLADLYTATPEDWSDYLDEESDETEFEFGSYAQNNYLKYKESDDVLKDNGRGNMTIDDETLPIEKTQFELPVSTADEVTILDTINVSRIAMNEFDPATDTYTQNDKIDPRIVYVDNISGTKTFVITSTVTGKTPSGTEQSFTSPKTAHSIDIAMSSLIGEYSGLSRLLTKTKLKKLKFNLPEVIVANMDHSIPVYLRQYNAVYYVNKISNYVSGKLTTVELVKL